MISDVAISDIRFNSQGQAEIELIGVESDIRAIYDDLYSTGEYSLSGYLVNQGTGVLYIEADSDPCLEEILYYNSPETKEYWSDLISQTYEVVKSIRYYTDM
jgi:hypothetical protein